MAEYTEYIVNALSALITGLLAFAGVLVANSRMKTLFEYRLGEVEKKLDKHNHFEERISELETSKEVQAAELHRHNERLKTLEARP